MRPSTAVQLFVLSILTLPFVVETALAAEMRVDLQLRADDITSRSIDGERVLDFAGAIAVRSFGEVELPSRTYTFAVGRGETVEEVRLEGERSVRLGRFDDLRIVGELVATDGRSIAREMRFSGSALERAGTMAMYPPVAAEIVGVHFLHGQKLVTVQVYPVRRDAAGDVFLLEDATLVAVTGPAAEVNGIARRQRDPGNWYETTRAKLARMVVNPQDLDLPRPPVRTGGDVANAMVGPSLESEPVRHLIITDADMQAEFEVLAQHRTNTGTPSLVVTLDDVRANARQGADLAETVRYFIIDAYERWGVDYVLLGGDTEIVPTRYVRSTFYPPGDFTDIPTDLYYGGLDTNWNSDGDELFGEAFVSSVNSGDSVDFGPEVAVGRAPVNTPVEAASFVGKVMAYEMPQTTAWLHRALFASEVLFPLAWSEPDPVNTDGASLSEDLINNHLQPCSDPDWDLTRLYERPELFPGSEMVSVNAVVDSLDSGNFSLFHHIGHGFYFNMSVGNGSLGPAEVDGLTNAPNFFLLYSLNCSSSAFDFNCLNERFVRNPNGGAAVSLGSSRAAFPSGAKPLQEAFYRAWMCDGIERVGDVMGANRETFLPGAQQISVTRWTQLVYTLIGDPATRLWSYEPVVADVFPPSSHPLGARQMTVAVVEPGVSGIEGVTVTASKDGEDFASTTTGPGGVATFPFSAETVGDITIWVSGGGVLPQSTTIPVTDPSLPVPSVLSFSISDDGLGASDGNGNGTVEAGETVEITPILRNGASVDYPGGTVWLRSDDVSITVLDSVATAPAIPAGQSVSLGESFVASFDVLAADGHAVDLEFEFERTGDHVFDHETLTLGAPEVEVAGLSLPTVGMGTINIGQTVDLVFTLKNFGDGAANGLTGTLSVTDGNATVLKGSCAWPDAAGSLASVDNDADRLQIRADGTVADIRCELTITDDRGRSLVHGFDLIRPASVSGLRLLDAGPGALKIGWDKSGDADLLGYRVYRQQGGAAQSVLVTADVILGIASFRDEGLDPLSVFSYEVAAVDAGGLEGPRSSAFSASTNPPELSCFPLPLGLETSGALAIGYTDHDYTPDMVIGADYVYVINGECQEKVNGDSDAQTFGPVFEEKGRFGPASIALGELSASPGQEIVALNRDTFEVFVLDGDGQVLPGWPVRLKNWAWAAPVVGDLDGDGDFEIVIHDIGGRTYAFNADGTEVADGDNDPATVGPIIPQRVQDLSGGGTVTEFFGRTTPALFDVDGNGSLEIIFGSKFQNASADDEFYAFRADGSGTHAPGWPKTIGPRSEFLASPSIGDIDDDGVMEIVAACENDSLYVWEVDGSREPGFPIRIRNNSINVDSLTPSPALADFTGDGKLEIVVVEVFREVVDGNNIWRSYVHVLDQAGNDLPGWPVVVDDLSESSPVVGDLDGDGSLDVLYGIGGNEADDALFAWNVSGQPVQGFPIPINGFVRATPTLTDFDQDGTTDIALATWDRLIHVWDTPATYAPELVPWPTFRGNVNRTGVVGQAVVTATDPVPTLGRQAVLAPPAPNPFNPQTVLRFSLPQPSSNVRLDVFDAKGRHVRVLASGDFAAGVHDLRWDGRDDAGRAVSSGVYFASLRVDGLPSGQRKLALVK